MFEDLFNKSKTKTKPKTGRMFEGLFGQPELNAADFEIGGMSTPEGYIGGQTLDPTQIPKSGEVSLQVIRPNIPIQKPITPVTPVTKKQPLIGQFGESLGKAPGKVMSESLKQFNAFLDVILPMADQTKPSQNKMAELGRQFGTAPGNIIRKAVPEAGKLFINVMEQVGRGLAITAGAPIAIPTTSLMTGQNPLEVTKKYFKYLASNLSGSKNFANDLREYTIKSDAPVLAKLTTLIGIDAAQFGNPAYYLPYEKVLSILAKATITKKVFTPLERKDIFNLIKNSSGGKQLTDDAINKLINGLIFTKDKTKLIDALNQGELFAQKNIARFPSAGYAVKPEPQIIRAEARPRPGQLRLGGMPSGARPGFIKVPKIPEEIPLTSKDISTIKGLGRGAIFKPIIETGKPAVDKDGFSGFNFKDTLDENLQPYVNNVEQIKIGQVNHLTTDGKEIGIINNLWEDGKKSTKLTLNYFSANEIAKKHGALPSQNLVATANEWDAGTFIRGLEGGKDKINLIKIAPDGYFVLGANRYNGYGTVTFFEKRRWDTKNTKYLESLLKRGTSFTSGGAADPSSSLQQLLKKRTEAVDSRAFLLSEVDKLNIAQPKKPVKTLEQIKLLVSPTPIAGKGFFASLLKLKGFGPKAREKKFIESIKKERAEEEAKQKVKVIKSETMAKAKQVYDRQVARIKTNKEILARRRHFIKAIQKQFGLSDDDLKSITKKDIRLMSNLEFKNFLDDIRIKSEQLAERYQAQNELITQIKEKNLNIEPLRESMKLPPISKMTTTQLRQIDEALRPFQKDDVFLGKRKLETINRTELDGIKTYREARERLAKKLDTTVEELQSITIRELDRFRGDIALANRNPFFKMMVEETARLQLIREAEFLDIKQKAISFAKKLPSGIIGKIIPQQKNIARWFEAKDKSTIELTQEEIELTKFMQEEWSKALDYLIKQHALNKGINTDNYFTHIRRNFLEAVKEDGVIQAFKEILDQYRLDEQSFNILDQQTGEVLALDKFFRFAMKRTGELKPSENIVQAFLSYMRIFKKKQALDEIVPLIDIYANSLTPKGVTKTGLLLHGNMLRFTKEWLNTKKGRTVTLIAKQGGKIDWVLRIGKTFTTLMDLGLNIPVSIFTQIGEQAVTYQLLGKVKFFNAKIRALTPQGRKITAKYRNFIGENPWKELIEPAKAVGNRLSEGLFILFRDANIRRTRNFLLGSMTKEEFKAGEISAEKLANLRTQLGRYAVIENAKSIVGATSEAGQFTQYKSWALPIIRSIYGDVWNLRKLFGKDKEPGKKALLELWRLVEMTSIVIFFWSLYGYDEKDDSFIGKLKQRAYQESFTFLQALSPETFLTSPRNFKFVEDLAKNITSILKLEEYEESKFGEYEAGELKGLNRLIKQLTPRAIKQFDQEKVKTLDDIKKEISQDIQEGRLDVSAAKEKFVNEVKKLEGNLKEKRFEMPITEYKKNLMVRIENKEITVAEAKEEFIDYAEKNADSFESKDDSSFIEKIKLYSKAIGTDPVTAFHRIFTNQKIRRIDNGAIIVYRLPVEESQIIKQELGATKDLILDHTTPLELGGDNSESNLKLVLVEDWERYTVVENYLGDKLRAGLITKKEAQNLIIRFKKGEINENDIIK